MKATAGNALESGMGMTERTEHVERKKKQLMPCGAEMSAKNVGIVKCRGSERGTNVVPGM